MVTLAPYYQDDLVTLYHFDATCMTEWLDADVLITDPPYGIAWSRGTMNRKREAGHAGIRNDHDTSARDTALVMWGDVRPAVVFGSLQAEYPDGWKRMLVFQKPEITGVVGSRAPWRRDWEPIFVLGRWPDQAPMFSSVIRTSEKSAGGYIGYATKAGHPHAKPIDVLARLIEACPPGTIADPFAGSGSTLLAARILGRKAIGVEIDEAHCETAAKRLSQHELDFEGWTA